MREKINRNLQRGRYEKKLPAHYVTGYVSTSGWIDYLIGEKIIFSHRVNFFSQENLPEQLHSHEYYELVAHMGNGEMQYVTDGQYLSAKKGTIILTKPWAVHMFRPEIPADYDRYVFYFKKNFQFSMIDHDAIFDFLDAGTSNVHYISLTEMENTVFLDRVKQIETVLKGDTKYSDTLALTYIAELFAMFSARLLDEDLKTAEVSSPAPEFICTIKNYIDENYVSISSVSDVAEQFFYSREYVTRVFRKYFNTPIYEYIIKRKILFCCSQIRLGRSIEEAAAEAGFHNTSSFIKLFKKNMGMTPSAYRDKI